MDSSEKLAGFVSVALGVAKSRNAGGTLTVFDGAGDSVELNFAGTYKVGSFTLKDDGSGGTLIVDPPALRARPSDHGHKCEGPGKSRAFRVAPPVRGQCQSWSQVGAKNERPRVGARVHPASPDRTVAVVATESYNHTSLSPLVDPSSMAG